MIKLLFSLVIGFAVSVQAEVFKGNALQLLITGSADLAYVQSIVSPYGVKPVLDKHGRAIASLAFVQYVSTSVGPYNEFIVMYAVQRNDQNIKPLSPLMYTLKNSFIQKDAKNPEYGYYMHTLVLGGDNKNAVGAAIDVGRNGYGFPKISGDVEYALDPSEEFQLSVKSHDGSVDVTASLASSYLGGINLVAAPVVLHALTSGFGYPFWSRSVGFAWLGTPQSSKTLKLSIQGSELKDIGFQPATILYSGRYRFELEGAK